MEKEYEKLKMQYQKYLTKRKFAWDKSDWLFIQRKCEEFYYKGFKDAENRNKHPLSSQ